MSKSDTPKENSNKENTTDHKLTYIGDISVRTKKKIGDLYKRFCKNTDINIILTPFKTGSLISSKDRLPNALRSFVVYKEHLVTDRKSHIMKHLLQNKSCKNLHDESCFQVINYASSPFRLKVKEALHINWLKPDLNKQKEDVNITISV